MASSLLFLVMPTILHAPAPLCWRIDISGILGGADDNNGTIMVIRKVLLTRGGVTKVREKAFYYQLDKNVVVYNGRERITLEELEALWKINHPWVRVTLIHFGRHVYKITVTGLN